MSLFLALVLIIGIMCLVKLSTSLIGASSLDNDTKGVANIVTIVAGIIGIVLVLVSLL